MRKTTCFNWVYRLLTLLVVGLAAFSGGLFIARANPLGQCTLRGDSKGNTQLSLNGFSLQDNKGNLINKASLDCQKAASLKQQQLNNGFPILHQEYFGSDRLSGAKYVNTTIKINNEDFTTGGIDGTYELSGPASGKNSIKGTIDKKGKIKFTFTAGGYNLSYTGQIVSGLGAFQGSWTADIQNPSDNLPKTTRGSWNASPVGALITLN